MALRLVARLPQRVATPCLAEGNLRPEGGLQNRRIAAAPLATWCNGLRGKMAEEQSRRFADRFRSADDESLWHLAREPDAADGRDGWQCFAELEMPRSDLV